MMCSGQASGLDVCENKVAMSLEKTSYCVFWDTYVTLFARAHSEFLACDLYCRHKTQVGITVHTHAKISQV